MIHSLPGSISTRYYVPSLLPLKCNQTRKISKGFLIVVDIVLFFGATPMPEEARKLGITEA